MRNEEKRAFLAELRQELENNKREEKRRFLAEVKADLAKEETQDITERANKYLAEALADVGYSAEEIERNIKRVQKRRFLAEVKADLAKEETQDITDLLDEAYELEETLRKQEENRYKLAYYTQRERQIARVQAEEHERVEYGYLIK